MRSRATRRARTSESSSASTATRLAIEWRPPENRRSEVSSATRAVGRGSRTAVSSAFTSAVSDTCLLSQRFGNEGQAYSATGLFAPEVSMLDPHCHTRFGREPLRELARDDDRSVLPPGAPDRDDRVALVLALIALEHGVQRGRVGVDELSRAGL